jgi:hypothetical protein
MNVFDDIGVAIPEVYLPKRGLDLQKWAVVACDQFTSEPEYWRKVEQEIGNAPSTLNLIFPEIYLEAPGKDERIRRIQSSMQEYLAAGLLEPREGMVYVERTVDGSQRRGLLLCLDLDRYDYQKGASSLIRATEGTIVERLPPRMSIREDAVLELPHILVLIDDPARTVIEPIAMDSGLQLLYDFDLMFDSGHLRGFGLNSATQNNVIAALQKLADGEAFQKKYRLPRESPVLLFAMGDGNHSLATAKAVWEKLKSRVGPRHPARYALVEIVNVHDKGLEFEPIHRVLFGIKKDFFVDLQQHFGGELRNIVVGNPVEMARRVDSTTADVQVIGLIQGGANPSFGVIEFGHPTSNLPVGTLQQFLDDFMKHGGAEKIDYVHGGDVTVRLGSLVGNAGFYLPRMAKSSLFKTVIVDGALPRKTFSMGEAREKRFYMEARKIV